VVRRFRPSPGTVMGLIALVVAGGGLALAATSSSGVVHGCVNKRSGVLRVLHGSQRCSKHESKLNFNKQGPPGAAIVLRARGSSSVATQSCSGGSCTPFSPQVYPVSPVSWTQGGTEDDQLLGVATVTSTGAACASGPFPTGFGPSISVLVDGKVLTGSFSAIAPPAGTSTMQIPAATLFEPGVKTHHTISVRISDTCNTGTHYTVKAVKLDVVAMR
jgi:hypothetical protein